MFRISGNVMRLTLTAVLLWWGCFCDYAVAENAFSLSNLPQSVEAKFQGNHSDTSIHYTVKNNSNKPVSIDVQAGKSFFKNSGGYQDLVAGESQTITVPPNSSASGKISGFCINNGIPAPGPGVGTLTPSGNVSTIPGNNQTLIAEFLQDVGQFEKEVGNSVPSQFKQGIIYLTVLRTDLHRELSRLFPYLGSKKITQIVSELSTLVRTIKASDFEFNNLRNLLTKYKFKTKKITEKHFDTKAERNKFYQFWEERYGNIFWQIKFASLSPIYSRFQRLVDRSINRALKGLDEANYTRTFTSNAGKKIILTEKNWDEVVLRNPTIRVYQGNIKESLSNPDFLVTHNANDDIEIFSPEVELDTGSQVEAVGEKLYTIDSSGSFTPVSKSIENKGIPATQIGSFFKWYPNLLGGKYFVVEVRNGRVVDASISDRPIVMSRRHDSSGSSGIGGGGGGGGGGGCPPNCGPGDDGDGPGDDDDDDESSGGPPPPNDHDDPFDPRRRFIPLRGSDELKSCDIDPLIPCTTEEDVGVDDILPTSNNGFTETIDISEGPDDGIEGSSNNKQMVHKEADPVILRTGEFVLTEIDLRIPGRGFDFVMQRTYRSQFSLNGPLGHSWDFLYNERLFLPPSSDSGLSKVRRKGLGRLDTYMGKQDGSFISPPGFYDELHKNSDGTWTIRDRHGFKKNFDVKGRLSSLMDRQGNTMTFTYDELRQLVRVTDTLGREIVFAYNKKGRLMAVTDFYGREIRYAYDDNGDLVAVRSPIVVATSIRNDFPFGKITRYEYASGFESDADPRLKYLNHNLTAIIDPKGQRYLVNSYGTDPDSYEFDRVVKQQVGDDKQVYTLRYTELNPQKPISPDLLRNETVVTDRNGNRITYVHNQVGNLLEERRKTNRNVSPKDTGTFITKHTYNHNGQRLSTTFPERNRVEYEFDEDNPDPLQQGNLIAITQHPGPHSGDQKQIRITRQFEPIFNQLRTVTDPRGNAASYHPQNGGTSTPERYQTTFTFDYQEGQNLERLAKEMRRTPQDVAVLLAKAGVKLSRGDVNGDGHTNQIHGNIIRRTEPAVRLLKGPPSSDKTTPSTQSIISTYSYNVFGQLMSETDPERYSIQYVYFPENDPDGDGVVSDSSRSLTDKTGGYRQAVRYNTGVSEDLQGKPSDKIIENKWFYDEVGNVIRFIDGRGNPTEYERNTLNQIVRIIAPPPLKYRHRIYYDDNNNVSREEMQNADTNGPDLDGFTTYTYEYDNLDNRISQTEEVSTKQALVTKYVYDNNENLVQIIQPEGNVVRRAYDERNLVVSVTRGLGTSEAAKHSLKYDGNGNLVRIIDATDNSGDGGNEETRVVYDGFDRPIRLVDSMGNMRVSEYDPAGNRIRIRQFGLQEDASSKSMAESGKVRLAEQERFFDELNREFQRNDLLFTNLESFGKKQQEDQKDEVVTTRFEYDRKGRITRVLNDHGHQHRYEYDGVNRLISEIDGLKNEIRYAYDHNHNLVETVEIERSPEATVSEERFTAKREYDVLNRLIAIVDNLGNRQTFNYDSRNNLIKKIDRLGNTTTYVYDGINRLLAENVDLRRGGIGDGAIDTSNPANADGRITTAYVWDKNSRLTSITDDNGNATTYEYDALNRRIKEAFADDTINQYQFDGDDNVVTFIDQNGSVHRHTYDALNRLTTKTVTRGLGVQGSTRWQFGYDDLSRLTRATDNNDPANDGDDSELTFQYDSLSRLLVETQNGTRVESNYDKLGNRLSLTYPNGRAVKFNYDALNRIKGIADQGSSHPIAKFQYIGPNRVLERHYGNGTRLSYRNKAGNYIGYDGLRRRVTHRHENKAGDLVAGFEQVFDREGNRRNEIDQFTNLADVFDYDSAYRLTRTRHQVPGVTAKSIENNNTHKGKIEKLTSKSQTTYQFDGVGNWIHRGADGQETLFTANKMNAYESIDKVEQQHDANGNLTRDGPRRYIYDFANRLVQVMDDKGTELARYTYDALGRRIQKFTPQKTITFFYDGARSIEERDVNDKTVRQYVFGLTIDEVLEVRANGLSYYYHDNWLGSIVALTDQNGKVVERYRYSEYGQTTIFDSNGKATLAKSKVGNPFRFTGRRYDSETGIYYYRARYYDPNRGRFLQQDPKGYIDGMGLYEYVGGNPLNWIDPLGTSKESWVSKGASFAGDVLLNKSDIETARKLWEVGNWWEKGIAGAGIAVFTVDAGFNFLTGGTKGAVKQGIKKGFTKALRGLNTIGKGIGNLGKKGLKGVGIGIKKILLGRRDKEVTVGRWMSSEEFGKMKKYKKVQESRTGTTHVVYPAKPESFMKQAKPGSYYVEFDVPASSVKKTQEGWGKIIGPNTIEGRFAAKKGLPVPQMPPAENIIHKATKLLPRHIK